MSPYIKRAPTPMLPDACSLPKGWFRRDGALWQCHDCGRIYELVRHSDFTGNWKTWNLTICSVSNQ